MLCLIPAKLAEAAILIPTLSLMTAALAWFIQYTLMPGEIFGKYGVLLNFLWIKSAHKTYLFGKHNERRPRRWWAWLLPPAGLCPYCSSVWTGTAFYAVTCYLLQLPLFTALFAWPLFVGVQYGWVRLFAGTMDASDD